MEDRFHHSSLRVYIVHICFCSVALCSDPVDINYGMVTFAGNSVGDNATYTCDPGFELSGDAIRVCTEVDANSTLFRPGQPFCRRELCVDIAMRVCTKVDANSAVFTLKQTFCR